MKRTELQLIAAIVLFAGLAAGAAIYLFADDERSATSYVIVGDAAYPVDPASTKAYVRQLERFGGKAAVIFDDFNRWFAALWQGKALGVTIIWLSVFFALALFAIARKLRPERD
jgi:hypothetical protein